MNCSLAFEEMCSCCKKAFFGLIMTIYVNVTSEMEFLGQQLFKQVLFHLCITINKDLTVKTPHKPCLKNTFFAPSSV